MQGRQLVTRTLCKIPLLEDAASEANVKAAKAANQSAIRELQEGLGSHSSEKLVDVIAILAVNQKDEPWNDSDMVTMCRYLVEQLAQLHDLKGSNKSVLHTLLNRFPKLGVEINCLISNNLRRESWQDHAMMCSLYIWYCEQLSFPIVSEYLDTLLPPSLNLVDSYLDDMKVAGVRCLSHIMSECGKAELHWHSRAYVILDALQKLTYSKYEPLIVILHPALIQVLEVLATHSSTNKTGEEVYRRLLGDMYLEDKLTLRRSYAHSMKLHVSYMGRKVIKHLKETMKIMLNYLEDSCGSTEITRLTMLDTLEVILKSGQPRVDNYHKDIVKTLLRLIVDTVVLPIDTDTSTDIQSRVSNLLQALCVTQHSTINYIPLMLENIAEDLAKWNVAGEGGVEGSQLLSTIESIRTHLSS